MCYKHRFEQDLKSLMEEKRALIETLRLDIELSGADLDEFFFEQLDELKGVLAADAANAASDDRKAQEAAIEEAEAWVTDTVSGQGYSTDIAITLYLDGIEAGVRRIRQQLH